MYIFNFAVHYVRPKEGIEMEIRFRVLADSYDIAFEKAKTKEYALRSENLFLQKSMSTMLRFVCVEYAQDWEGE